MIWIEHSLQDMPEYTSNIAGNSLRIYLTPSWRYAIEKNRHPDASAFLSFFAFPKGWDTITTANVTYGNVPVGVDPDKFDSMTLEQMFVEVRRVYMRRVDELKKYAADMFNLLPAAKPSNREIISVPLLATEAELTLADGYSKADAAKHALTYCHTYHKVVLLKYRGITITVNKCNTQAEIIGFMDQCHDPG